MNSAKEKQATRSGICFSCAVQRANCLRQQTVSAEREFASSKRREQIVCAADGERGAQICECQVQGERGFASIKYERRFTMSNQKKQNFKNTKAYKIIVGILLLLCIGYKIYTSISGEDAEDVSTDKTEYSQELSEDSVEYSQDISEEESSQDTYVEILYSFRSNKLWESHYEKHGIDMGFEDKEAYLEAANAVVMNEDTLHKIEAEDGDDVYYLEETNEFVVVSTDGYLRTYFCPDDGLDYYNRQ